MSLSFIGKMIITGIAALLIITGVIPLILKAGSQVPIEQAIRDPYTPSGQKFDDNIALSWFDYFTYVLESYAGTTPPKNHGCFIYSNPSFFYPGFNYYWEVTSSSKRTEKKYQLSLFHFKEYHVETDYKPKDIRQIKTTTIEGIQPCAVAGEKRSGDFPSNRFLDFYIKGNGQTVRDDFTKVKVADIMYTNDRIKGDIGLFVIKKGFDNFFYRWPLTDHISEKKFYYNLFSELEDGKIAGTKKDEQAIYNFMTEDFLKQRNLFDYGLLYVPSQGNICFVPFEDDRPQEGIEDGDDYEIDFQRKIIDWSTKNSDYICEPKFLNQVKAGEQYDKFINEITKCISDVDDSFTSAFPEPISIGQSYVNNGFSVKTYNSNKKEIGYNTKTIPASLVALGNDGSVWYVVNNHIYNSVIKNLDIDMNKEVSGASTTLSVVDIAATDEGIIAIVSGLSEYLMFSVNSQGLRYMYPAKLSQASTSFTANTPTIKIIGADADYWYVLDRNNQKITQWSKTGLVAQYGLVELFGNPEKYQVIFDVVFKNNEWYFLIVDLTGKWQENTLHLFKLKKTGTAFEVQDFVRDVAELQDHMDFDILNDQVVILQKYNSNKLIIYNKDLQSVSIPTTQKTCPAISIDLPRDYSIDYAEEYVKDAAGRIVVPAELQGHFYLRYKDYLITDKANMQMYTTPLTKFSSIRPCLCKKSGNIVDRDCSSRDPLKYSVLHSNTKSKEFSLMQSSLCINEVNTNVAQS